MNLIQPTVEPLIQGPGINGLFKHIEQCARICYRSEGGNVNPEKFVEKLISRGHLRPIEFGTVALQPKLLFQRIKWRLRATFSPWVIRDDKMYITNLRYLYEHETNWRQLLNEMPDFLAWKYRPTFKWHIARVIADEFRSHIMLSTCMESTRYVNYNKTGIDFVEPCWLKDKPIECRYAFERSLSRAEDDYNYLITVYKCAPQESRDVLPLNVATRMVQCAFRKHWLNFFRLRIDKAAHPDARSIAEVARKLF